MDFPNGLGNIPLTEFVNKGNDFLHQVHQTNIAQFSRFSLTDKTISKSVIPRGSQEFYLATYKARCLGQAPIFTINHLSLQEHYTN